MSTAIIYDSHRIKFCLNVPVESPLSWYDYFGYEGAKDMMSAFSDKYLVSDTVSFFEYEIKDNVSTVVFETSCDPKYFAKDYNLVVAMLQKISTHPEYNDDAASYNYALDRLEEEGIVVMDDRPETDVFEEFNLLVNGYRTYQERLERTLKRPTRHAHS
jgi:hypothetical protein